MPADDRTRRGFTPELERLISGAEAAGSDRRIEYRDAIAAFGAPAISAVSGWLSGRLGAFAVRVIEKAAAHDARGEAILALRSGRAAADEHVKRDIDGAMARLGSPSGIRRSARVGVLADPPEELVIGHLYRRRELHHAGWGGNPRSGISYPAHGEHVLLFADPRVGEIHGYRDAWAGDRYRFYGQWDGTGDMTMTLGNAAVRDRSPQLHLFIREGELQRYEGRFRLDDTEIVTTSREGASFHAFVFVLSRAES